MFRYYKFILSIILSLTLVSCSHFRGVGIRKQKGESEWKITEKPHPYWSIGTKTPVYGIKKNNLSVSIWPCPKPNWVILIGPPIVPVIPNPMLLVWPFLNNGSKGDILFFVNFRFINMSTDTILIDLTKVNFENKHKVLSPSNLSMLDPHRFSYIKQDRTVNTKRNEINNIPIPSFYKIKPADTLIVSYDFNEWSMDVNKLTIKFDNISNTVILPPITYKTKLNFVYQPIYDN